MLAIRLKRLGKKGYPTYRVVVQDSRRSPHRGRVVAQIGNYNPHTKAATVDKDKAKFYLDNGAHPSERVTSIFKAEKIKLPSWTQNPAKQKKAIKNPQKLRKNRPADAPAPQKPEAEKPEDKPEPEKPAEEPKQPDDKK